MKTVEQTKGYGQLEQSAVILFMARKVKGDQNTS